MRIRITRSRQGEVDGVELATFEVGLTYDVAPSLAAYLVTTESAEFVDSDARGLVTPLAGLRNRVTAMRLRKFADSHVKPPAVFAPEPSSADA